ncbi:MAG: sulfotransferase [Bacteroidetes bacterium]|nr:sulfotransferase [Bacteroidota bacterium]
MENFRQSPIWFRFLNKVWKGTYPLGTEIRLDKDDLFRRARKVTGLQDMGRDFNVEPLERLLKSANEEANLHPIGRFITRERFVSLLSIRLRAEYFFKKYPQILQQELYPAWIIVGLQRTGTTKLQRLLAEDPEHRVVPSWEVINPVPIDLQLYERRFAVGPSHHFASVYPDRNDKRIAIANTSVKALKFMSPGFFAIHPINAMQPEEDILMLDVSFMSTTPEAMMHVPSYAGWLESADQSEAYAYMAKLLKFMQWINPAKRWVLKTPHHLEFPGLIEKHFGEVHFLWPHRNLHESVPSFLSMVTYNRMIFSDRVDVRQVADHWVRKIGYMLDQAIDYRLHGANTNKFTDIFYKNLLTDSAAEMGKIYQLNGGLTPLLAERFRLHELEHPHQKHGVHQYSLADFGLTETEINRNTANYTQFISKQYGRSQT